jgi:hypothetical protein
MSVGKNMGISAEEVKILHMKLFINNKYCAALPDLI